MAKKSMVAREAKRQKIVDRYAEKRAALKGRQGNEGLSKLPCATPPTLVYIIVVELGRPHSVYRKFGLSRVSIFANLRIKVKFLV